MDSASKGLNAFAAKMDIRQTLCRVFTSPLSINFYIKHTLSFFLKHFSALQQREYFLKRPLKKPESKLEASNATLVCLINLTNLKAKSNKTTLLHQDRPTPHQNSAPIWCSLVQLPYNLLNYQGC